MPAGAQAPQAPQAPQDTAAEAPPLGFSADVVPPARTYLDAHWDDEDATQSERAYCGAPRVLYDRAENALRLQVFDLYPAHVEGASPVGIDKIECPPGLVIVHTHPPSNCSRDLNGHVSDCTLDRWRERPGQCRPSKTDERALNTIFRNSSPFFVIQCGRGVYTFVFALTQDAATSPWAQTADLAPGVTP